MHSCLYLQVLYRGGPKTDCSTVLGLFTSRSEGGGQCHNYRRVFVGWVGWRITCIGSERARTAEYILGDEDTKQKHGKVTLLLIQQHHVHPHINLMLLLNTLNMEFSTTAYCVTLYKDMATACPWGPSVMSRCLDWKTWIWSQSSSRAVVVVVPSVSAGSLLFIYSRFIAGCFSEYTLSVWECFHYPKR